MAEIKTIYKGESVTILFTFHETYNMERLSSHKVFVGETEFAGVKDGQTVKLQLKSSDTNKMVGTHKVILWLEDTTLGLRKPYCCDLVVAKTQASGDTELVSNISDIIIPIVISETAITVGDIMYNYVKGDPFLYSDFTPEQLEALKVKGDPFLYEDFTPEQIAELQQPATEASESIALLEGEIEGEEALRVTAEATRAQNEQGRVTAEGTRQQNETARVNAEDDREDAEALRLSAEITRGQNEQARITAESTRQTNTAIAIQNANNAATNANTKAGLADTAANNANEKAGLADTAAQNANEKAGLADTAAQNANAIADSKPTIFEGYANLAAGVETTIAGTSFNPVLNLKPIGIQAFLNGELKDVTAKYVVNGANYDLKLTSSVDLIGVDIVVLSTNVKLNNYNLIPDISTKQEIVLSTYDGSGETIHPSVVYFENGWNGYKYWMANTPLPGSQANPSAFENPCIWASNDGVAWVLPNGLINPIVPTPYTGFNSDTDMIFDATSNKLYVIWKENSNGARIKMISSSDGVIWGDIKTVLTPIADETECISPSIIKVGSVFFIYYVYYLTSASDLTKRGIRRVSSGTIDGIYGNRQEIVAPRTQRRAWWHMDVERINGAFIIVASESHESSTGDIFTLSSIDGIDFKLDSSPLITPTQNFDMNGCYRPSIIKVGSDYFIYYSAKSIITPKSTLCRIKVSPVLSNYQIDFNSIISDSRKIIGYYYPKLIENVVQSSGKISQITDLSVNDNHFSTITEIRKPTFDNGALFNGTSNFIKTIFTDKIRYMIIVLEQKGWTENSVIMDGANVNASLIRQKTASPGIAMYMSSTYSQTSNELPLNQPGILRISFDNLFRKYIVDNNAPISIPSTNSAHGGITLGANGIGEWYSKVNIKAVAIFKYMPTENEDKLIYNKLATDCGLPTI